MNKRDLLSSMWDRVTEIRDGMQEIEENIYSISDCIDSKKFLAPEAAESVMKNLGKIEEASAFCKDNYESLSGEEFAFDELASLEASLREIDIILSNQEEVETAKRFLALSCADEIARPYLVSEQDKVSGILNGEDSFTVAKDADRLAGLKPYARYMKAFDEPRMVNVLDYIPELRDAFDDELVAALLDKQISEAAAETTAVEIPVEETAEPAAEVVVESAEDITEPEVPSEETDEPEISEPAVDMPSEETDEPEISEPAIDVPSDDIDEPEISEPAIDVPSDDIDEPEISEPAIDVPSDDIDEPEISEPAIDVPSDDIDEPDLSVPSDSPEEPDSGVSFNLFGDDEPVAEPAEEAWEPEVSIPIDSAEEEEPAAAPEEKPKESTGFFGRWF